MLSDGLFFTRAIKACRTLASEEVVFLHPSVFGVRHWFGYTVTLVTLTFLASSCLIALHFGPSLNRSASLALLRSVEINTDSIIVTVESVHSSCLGRVNFVGD